MRVTGPFRVAFTMEDAEIVRRLRNAGRQWFGDAEEIDEESQRRWWAAKMATPQRDFICILMGEPPQGYGTLTRRDGRLWVSLAVDPTARGSGLGTKIYGGLKSFAAPEPVFAGILHRNVASWRAAEKAGYVRDESVAVPGVSDPAEWLVMRSA